MKNISSPTQRPGDQDAPVTIPSSGPHYYFERYEVLDGESEYNLYTLRTTDEPLSYDDWIREFIEFSYHTNREAPWTEKAIQEFLASDDQHLEVYGGMRIYRNFVLMEISKPQYDVLWKFIR